MNCLECPKRSTCKELCPEAEEYVNQDGRSMRAIRFTELGLIEETIQRGVNDIHTGFVDNGTGSHRREKGIVTCPLNGKKYYKTPRCKKCGKYYECWEV